MGVGYRIIPQYAIYNPVTEKYLSSISNLTWVFWDEDDQDICRFTENDTHTNIGTRVGYVLTSNGPRMGPSFSSSIVGCWWVKIIYNRTTNQREPDHTDGSFPISFE